ncbi:hypothetical protein [Kiloniella majae]|uniref:hypothetical protein n=1 Tax=Kiloniella majae TaxID=1938558 RepID=UPI000A276E0B|nr:hypothetical protein [Kiloniella majae]
MNIIYYFSKLVLLISVSTIMSACATWPKLKDDNKLDVTNAGNSKCYEAQHAKACALLTITEISELLEDAGDFDRITAYTLLGIGTATGATLAFDGSEDLLKGLAIGTGSLLGLDSVVNTDGQKTVLKAGLKSMACAYRTVLTLEETSLKLHDKSSLDEINSPLTFTSYTKAYNFLPNNTDLTGKSADELRYIAFVSGQGLLEEHAFEALSHSGNQITTSLDSARVSAYQKLSAAVINIRAEVRRGLAETVPNLDEIERDQSKRIVDMVGEVIKRRADLEEKEKNAGAGNTTNQQQVSAYAKRFITETAPIAAAFNSCIDSATQRILGST